MEPKFGELTKSRERVSYICIDNGRLCNVDMSVLEVPIFCGPERTHAAVLNIMAPQAYQLCAITSQSGSGS